MSVAPYFASAGLDYASTAALVSAALQEDLHYGPDITSLATIASDTQGSGAVVSRQLGIVSGTLVALEVLEQVGLLPDDYQVLLSDGALVAPGDTVLTVTGNLRKMLLAERTMLNFMTHLSGIATATKGWVIAVAGTHCQIRDTRKTTPGLRALEKYAVRCGGGVNHRLGLGDAALIKDNHVAALGSITAAIRSVRTTFPNASLEVECDTLDQVAEALAAGAGLILLDNMSDEEIRAACLLRLDHLDAALEASGGLSLERAAHLAALGVDYLAVGALTHSSPALDLGFDLT